MYILGINPGHDGTACLIDGEGRILAAVAEERISRIKFDFGIPHLAIEECLRLANLSTSDIDLVAIGFKSFFHPDTPVWNNLMRSKNPAPFDFDDFRLAFRSRSHAVSQILFKNLTILFGTHDPDSGKLHSNIEFTEMVMREIFRDLGFDRAKVTTVDHHLAHAASAYYTSGFDNPLIVTCDGAGDGLCGSINVLNNGEIERLHGASETCSPGLVYSEVTHHLGYKRNRHEGKITGLAAYGDEDRLSGAFEKCMKLSDDGKSFIYNLESTGGALSRKLKTFSTILKKQRIINSHISRVREFMEKELNSVSREDLSAGVQKRLEDCVARYVAAEFAKGRWKRIALAGGVFANVKLNQRIAEIPGVEEVFIHPNMGDGGISYGAAVLAARKNYSEFKIEPKCINDVYFGAGFTNDQIKTSLDRAKIEAAYYEEVEPRIAEYIADKKIVGRFDGRMEYGPRALGNRSILADPTETSINDWLNKRLGRTEFMPFAPSVLDRAAPKLYKNYTSGAYTSSFMTITFDVEKEWVERAPAVVHVDDTARPQVVKAEHNGSYYRILEEFEKLTGLPLFVNTSFNMHEEPILCTPEDAFRSLDAGSVDILAIGNFIVKKNPG